jgi:tRNA U34 5-carboxymethylaminomethyl modifying enzyme MnmG/GidA
MSKIDTSLFMNAQEIQQALHDMEQDELLNTGPILVRSAEDSIIRVSFRDRHTVYLKNHPKVNPQDYLSNIKTMIRIRV